MVTNDAFAKRAIRGFQTGAGDQGFRQLEYFRSEAQAGRIDSHPYESFDRSWRGLRKRKQKIRRFAHQITLYRTSGDCYVRRLSSAASGTGK